LSGLQHSFFLCVPNGHFISSVETQICFVKRDSYFIF
jgi:hypothetical protein